MICPNFPFLNSFNNVLAALSKSNSLFFILNPLFSAIKFKTVKGLSLLIFIEYLSLITVGLFFNISLIKSNAKSIESKISSFIEPI